MKIVHVNILMVILFSAILVSFSHAGASCCDPGAGCCSTSNVSGGQQQLRASSGSPSQTRVGTANKPAPQINPMPWSATVNQIGNPQCCPGTNSAGGCCPDTSGPVLSPNPRAASALTEIFAFNPFLGTLW